MANIESIALEYLAVSTKLLADTQVEDPDEETVLAGMESREKLIDDLRLATETEAVSEKARETLAAALELDARIKERLEAYLEQLREKVKQNNQGSRAVAGYRQAPAATYSTIVEKMQ